MNRRLLLAAALITASAMCFAAADGSWLKKVPQPDRDRLNPFAGKPEAAAISYKDALRIEPSNATARNGLASALLMQEHVPEAIQELREALRADPNYLNARYNLAHALVLAPDCTWRTRLCLRGISTARRRNTKSF
jgi:tetratricopeptide (TPR) repeat protein